MSRNDLLKKYLDLAVRESLHKSKAILLLSLNYIFEDMSFIGKSMLDIRGGSGLYSFFPACSGAERVICLEPELEGSRKGTFDKFKLLSTSLSLGNIDLLPVRFQEFDAGNQTFDIILLHNSINHLDEEACIKLQYDNDSRNRYGLILQKLSKIAAPGAKLIIADCSRYNFFASLGIKNPFAPTIEWHKHQSPEFWSNMLSNYGFINPNIRWMSFIGLEKIGRLLFGNRFASFFTTSHFLLVMDKNASKNPLRE